MDSIFAEFIVGIVSGAVLWAIIRSAVAAGIKKAAEDSRAAMGIAPSAGPLMRFRVAGKNLSGANLTVEVTAPNARDAGIVARAQGIKELKSCEPIYAPR